MNGTMNQDLVGKYLTFRMADEEYGLRILKVQEIIGLMPVTRVPQTPNFVRGVLNLRGKVIPVVDLRRKFGLPDLADTEITCIIILQVVSGDDDMEMGIIVDTVSEVLDIQEDELRPAPEFGGNIRTDFILAMCQTTERVVILLDIDRILSEEEIGGINQATAALDKRQNR